MVFSLLEAPSTAWSSHRICAVKRRRFAQPCSTESPRKPWNSRSGRWSPCWPWSANQSPRAPVQSTSAQTELAVEPQARLVLPPVVALEEEHKTLNNYVTITFLKNQLHWKDSNIRKMQDVWHCSCNFNPSKPQIIVVNLYKDCSMWSHCLWEALI